MKKKILSLLVLLVAAVTGAWATDAVPAYNLSVAESDNGSGTISYTVQDKDDAEKITENAKGANEGDKVTVAIAPDEGWVVDIDNVKAEVYRYWEGSRRAQATVPMQRTVDLDYKGKDANGVATYTFVMPASNVRVTPKYQKLSTLYFDPADKTNLMKVKKAGIPVNLDENDKTVKIEKVEGVIEGTEITLTANTGYKFRKVEVKKKAVGPTYPVALSAVTADYVGSVVCSDGNVYPAKTAAPAGKTAVGILGKVTETGHGLILALQDAALQEWETINGWTSVTTYAGTTLKLLPDNAARGTNLTSYTTLGETTVSNWAVAQKSDYEAIFVNLGSEAGDTDGITCSESMDVYILPAGGTSIWMASVLDYISATSKNDEKCWGFNSRYWKGVDKNRTNGKNVRPVLGF